MITEGRLDDEKTVELEEKTKKLIKLTCYNLINDFRNEDET